MQEGWKYYNHALIPTTPPHEPVNIKCINKASFWKECKGIPLFARWTSEFDCGRETEWWYVIKDTPFNIETIKSKKRYEIKKGLKNFEIKKIKPSDYAEDLFYVTERAYEQYPEKYKPELVHDSFVREISSLKSFQEVFAAFYKDTNILCGYAWINVYDTYTDFCVLKVNPSYEKYGINAAIVYAIVNRFSERLGHDFYICDGERTTFHETRFQDYLEKYFEFRKAYCQLNIKYRFPIGLFVKVLFCFRKKIKKEGKINSKISAVLMYESIVKGMKGDG